jgi:NEDD4-binding protein 2
MLVKMLIVMRGVPGSGKSTRAKSLKATYESLGHPVCIFSTDDFFVKNGVYTFVMPALGHAHAWNLNRALMAMIEGSPVVIVDNTNTTGWEPKPYVKAGLRLGYEVQIIEPETPWAFIAEECAKRTVHGVPVETIRAMLARWEKNLTVERIMASDNPFEKKAS